MHNDQVINEKSAQVYRWVVGGVSVKLGKSSTDRILDGRKFNVIEFSDVFSFGFKYFLYRAIMKASLMRKTIFVIKIIYTLSLIVFGIVAYNAGNNIYHYPKPELSPVWSFFGTSDWSVLITFYYISYFYLILNALSYLVKLIVGPLKSLTSPVAMKRVFSVFRLISTLLLLACGLSAFLAVTDIWHGYEPDLSMEWTFINVYFYLYYFYLIVSVVDICIKILSGLPHKAVKIASLRNSRTSMM